MSLLHRVERLVRKFDYVYTHNDGPWVYHMFGNPIPFSGSDYFPKGRFVFHRPLEQIPEIENTLLSQLRSRKIKVFKYAKKQLAGEEGPAIIVYARNNDREQVRTTLDSIGITDYEWRHGNPTRFDR